MENNLFVELIQLLQYSNLTPYFVVVVVTSQGDYRPSIAGFDFYER